MEEKIMHEFIALVREMRRVQDAVTASVKADHESAKVEGLSKNTLSLMVKQAELEYKVDEYLKKID